MVISIHINSIEKEKKPMKEEAILCKECNYRDADNGCKRKSGCIFIPAIIRLEMLLSA